MNRKNYVKKMGLGIIAVMITGLSFGEGPENLKTETMEKFDTHVFPALPYAYDALEPYIDARTMEIHYDKHHRAYFNNFVNAIKGLILTISQLKDICINFESR